MATDNLKVSIIVPVYNVEKYLIKCLESLVNQTYKNIEILLVDDGSTDSSGAICDNYALQYSNIRVFHKPNGGLSSARNFAIPYITGQYVAFVDSDDYVEINYVECLLGPIIGNRSWQVINIVICQLIEEDVHGIALNKENHNRPGSPSIEYMSASTALEAMCYRKITTNACGRIFTVDLVKKFPFPDGKLYEDLATMFYMIGFSHSIVFINVSLYHYVQRSGSIVHSPWRPSDRDIIDAAQGLLDYIDLYYPQIHKAGVVRFFSSMNLFYIKAFFESNYLDIINPVRKKLGKLWPDVMSNSVLPVGRKLQYWMMINTPRLYRRLWMILKNRSRL